MQTFVMANASFAKFLEPAPPAAVSIPSMMSRTERDFLFNLARHYYVGEGVIVDAGLFMGASTRAFGEGLAGNACVQAARGRFGRPIRSFELGVVNPGMLAFFKRHGVGEGLQVGDDFSHLLTEHIKPIADNVELTFGDIRKSAPAVEPIEILFLDVIKMPEIATFCAERYFGRLIPGRSVLLQQDYFIDQLPYLKTMQERFEDYFEYIGELMPMGVWRLRKALSPEDVRVILGAELSKDQLYEMATRAMLRTTDRNRQFLMGLSRVRLAVQIFGRARARIELAELEAKYPEQSGASKWARLKSAQAAVKTIVDGPAAGVSG